MRLFLATLVFAADLWALLDILGSDMKRGRRLKWMAVVVAMPIVGVLLWRRNQRRRPRFS